MATKSEQDLERAHGAFIEATSRIAGFWGLPRGLGAVYGAIYLSPEPLSLGEIVEQVGITKGAVSTHVRALDRLQLVHKEVRIGDRRDYYAAETNLWGVVKQVLRQRQNSEFDGALRLVKEALAALRASRPAADSADRQAFYLQRLEAMQGFFDSLDGIVAAVLALDDLRTSTINRLLGKGKKR